MKPTPLVPTSQPKIIELSGKAFLAMAVAAAALLWCFGRQNPWPAWLVGLEILGTVLAMFLSGSLRYQLDKNALTYGMAIVIAATTWGIWYPGSGLRTEVAAHGVTATLTFIQHHFMTLEGLENLVHMDTMLFILGLTFFVAVIAQTRLLESLSGVILTSFNGRLLPTIAVLTFLVAVASGVLDGVSMIGLLIRTLIIILVLGGAEKQGLIRAAELSTIITTVSGMWLAYGEPPNLIMKTNLHPFLTDGFFLRYCLPMAFGSYLVAILGVWPRLKGRTVTMAARDVLDVYIADLRFLQAMRHGEVLTPIGALRGFAAELGASFEPARERILKGETLGLAMVRANVPANVRRQVLAHYTHEDTSQGLDQHYVGLHQNPDRDPGRVRGKRPQSLNDIVSMRRRVQFIGGLAFVPFVGLLITHAFHPDVPLFIASMAGFAFAFLGIMKIPKIRKLALQEAVHEYKEYLFLFPLFFSITLLQKTGFFDVLVRLVDVGVQKFGVSHVAVVQFLGATLLSGVLDNNVVADFASKALHGLDIGVMHLFAMAQIAGYAVGGIWTPLGSAQAVVAFSFIRKEIDPHYSPARWIKAMSWVVFKLVLVGIAVIYVEGMFRAGLH